MKHETLRITTAWLAMLLAVTCPVVATSDAPARPVEDYAGSFEVESGEVITGGLFIEQAGGSEM